MLFRSGKTDEATATLKAALPLGNMIELHQYGRILIGEKKGKEALEVFKVNFDKFPNVFTTNVGLGRGYSAVGDYKKSLEYLKNALPQVPNQLNKANIEGMIKKLEEGKDIN